MTASARNADPIEPAFHHPTGFRGWHMVARGFVCQNVATGFLFGTFGTTLLAVQDRLHSNRATVSLGISLSLLTMGLISPLTARMLRRLTLPRTMLCGAIVSGAGYALLAVAPNVWVLLGAYAFFIGPGIAMFGPLPSTILASNWFVTRQGTAVGLVCVPLFTTLAPLLTVAVLDRFGLTTFYLSLAAAHLLLIPVILTIIERPALIGQEPLGGVLLPDGAGPIEAAATPTPVALFNKATFWILIVGGGMLNAVGIIAISHVFALALERGLNQVQGSLLVSVIGATSMVGALLVGFLCDRIGPARALAIAAGGFCVAWGSVLASTWLPIFILAVAVHGVCSGGVIPAVSVLSRHLFGQDAMARAMGLFYPLTLPFTFCFPPIAGWLRDATGSYFVVLIMLVVSSAFVSAAFLGLWSSERHALRRVKLAMPT